MSAATVRERAIECVRGHYVDFGPTLACEKLAERHDIGISRETLRHWMIDAGLWIPRWQRLAYYPSIRYTAIYWHFLGIAWLAILAVLLLD